MSLECTGSEFFFLLFFFSPEVSVNKRISFELVDLCELFSPNFIFQSNMNLSIKSQQEAVKQHFDPDCIKSQKLINWIHKTREHNRDMKLRIPSEYS